MEKKIRFFENVIGQELPYNLLWLRPKRGTEGAQKLCARFGGWLLKAAKSPECEPLRRLVKRATSPTGVGSPYTTLNLWGMVVGFRSPETATRKLVAVRRRANEILAPYGVRVSWLGLGAAMSSRRPTGKAAKMAAQQTLAAVLKGRFGVWEDNRFGSFSQVAGKRAFFLARGMAEALRDPQASCLGRWVKEGRFASLREALDLRETVGFVEEADGYRWCLRCNGLRRGRVVSNGDLLQSPHGETCSGLVVKVCSCEGADVAVDVIYPRYAVIREDHEHWTGSCWSKSRLLRWSDDHWDAANWGNALTPEELEAAGQIEEIGRFASWEEAAQFAAKLS